MWIKRNLYDKLVYDSPEAPPEIGGVLGGMNGVINTFAFDLPIDSNAKKYYVPNIEKLNAILSVWHDEKIKLYGIFHTHFPYGYALSNEDETYIHRIMHFVPESIKYLFFPVIVPGDGMAVFRATRGTGTIHIKTDEIVFV